MKKSIKPSIWMDGGLLWLWMTGLGGCLISYLELSVKTIELLLGVTGIAAIYVSLQILKKEYQKIVELGLMLCWTILGLIFFSYIKDGINVILNAGISLIGQRFPYVFPEFPVHTEKENYEFVTTMVCLWLSVLLSWAGRYLIRSGNRILLGIGLGIYFILQMVLGHAPVFFWNLTVFVTILLIWQRGHGEKLTGGIHPLALTENGILMLVLGCFVFGALQLILPKSDYEKAEIIVQRREQLEEKIEEERFGSESNGMPEGDFRELGPLVLTENPVLEITMSEPESYYLRGFEGSIYTGTGWEASSGEERWKYRDLFYWLHEEGLYGQEILGQAAIALDSELREKDTNTITVKNLTASSQYYYTPYELLAEEETRQNLEYAQQKVGDEGLISVKLQGNRSYSYEALSDQVTRFYYLTSKLYRDEDLDETGRFYQKLEGYYNQYVYETYLQLPENLKLELSKSLGNYNMAEGEKHADYTEAKQNILYYLNAECFYNQDIEEDWSGSDFIVDFLNRSKTGYSVHYASAVVMMFRYYGIPARYVEGYLVTPDDVESMEADEPYTLDETHAHAWAEYYQDGVGWLPFETTPSYMNVMKKAEEYQDISGAVTGSSQNSLEEEEEEETVEEDEEEKIDWLLVCEIVLFVLICLALLVFLGLLIWAFVQRRKSQKIKRMFTSADRNAAVRSIFTYTMNILSVAGLSIENTSLYAYQDSMEQMFDQDVRDKYVRVVQIRQEAVYSTHEISEEQRKEILDFKDLIWKRVYNGSNWVQKFQLKYIYYL